MSFFIWKDSFNTGIRGIDAQHRSIIDKINELYNSLGCEDKGKISSIIEDLTRYTVNHFSLEEKLFDTACFPESQAHRHQHDLFREKLADLKSDFEHGRSGVLGDALQFLKDWFMNHILSEDMKYKPYIGTINKDSIS